jgi:Tfp pilus assembly protein PilO
VKTTPPAGAPAPNRTRVALLAALAFALPAYLIGDSSWAQMNQLKAQAQAADQAATAASRQAAAVEAYTADQAAQDKAAVYATAVPDAPGIPDVLNVLQAAAAKSEVQLAWESGSLSEAQESTVGAAVAYRVSMQVTVQRGSGDPAARMRTFLDTVNALPRLVVVDNVTVSQAEAGGKLSGNLSLRIFSMAKDDPTVAAGGAK